MPVVDNTDLCVRQANRRAKPCASRATSRHAVAGTSWTASRSGRHVVQLRQRPPSSIRSLSGGMERSSWMGPRERTIQCGRCGARLSWCGDRSRSRAGSNAWCRLEWVSLRWSRFGTTSFSLVRRSLQSQPRQNKRQRSSGEIRRTSTILVGTIGLTWLVGWRTSGSKSRRRGKRLQRRHGGTLDRRMCSGRCRRVRITCQEKNVSLRCLFRAYSIVLVTKSFMQTLESIEKFSVSKASQEWTNLSTDRRRWQSLNARFFHRGRAVDRRFLSCTALGG